MATTKLYKNNQTPVPSIIHNKFDVIGGTIIGWSINENHEFVINFTKKSNIRNSVRLLSELENWALMISESSQQ